jgi:glycosyltransferase involved in cell wall biosynthesis
MIRASVVMPAYNAERHIEKALRSVLEQVNAGEYEVIVIDDRSNDRTVDVVAALAKDNPQIVCMPNTRAKGPSGARNAGLLAARGEYIAFLDADDAWLPNHLAKSLDFLDGRRDVGGVLHNFNIVDAATARVMGTWHAERAFARTLASRPLDDEYRLITAALLPAFLDESFMHLQATVLRRSLCRGVLFNEAVFRAEDRDFAIQLARNAELRLAFSDAVTGCYFRHEATLTSPSPENSIAALRDHVTLFEGYLAQFQDKQVLRKLAEMLFTRHVTLTYQYRRQGDFAEAYRSLKNSIRYRLGPTQLSELLKLIAAFTAAKIGGSSRENASLLAVLTVQFLVSLAISQFSLPGMAVARSLREGGGVRTAPARTLVDSDLRRCVRRSMENLSDPA